MKKENEENCVTVQKMIQNVIHYCWNVLMLGDTSFAHIFYFYHFIYYILYKH